MRNFILEDNETAKALDKETADTGSEDIFIIPPLSDMYNDMFIPQRFADVVESHIIASYIDGVDSFKPPMYLAIEGAAGIGKTAQTIATCSQKGFQTIYVSASALSGSHENEAREKLKKIYDKALEIREKELVVIVIDDFHKGIINTDDSVKKTINSDVLTGYMMNLAEYNGSEHIPVILTGNDFSHVYPPLLRTGRAVKFTWEPNSDEREETVFRIISSFVIINNKEDKAEYKKFYSEHSGENIAFFAQLKTKCIQQKLIKLTRTISYVNRDTLKRISRDFQGNTSKGWKCTVSELRESVECNAV